MGTTVSNIGGRQQIWNLGNNIIDTSNLVNLELQALEMKKTPYNNQKQTLSNERNVYASMNKEFNSFVQVFKDMYAFKGNEKKTSVSKEDLLLHKQMHLLLREHTILQLKKLQNVIKLQQDQ